MNISKALGVCLIGFCAAARTTIAGTLIVNAGDDLQAALNGAQPGDTILLQPGATFTGNFVLPAKGGSSYITIRSASDDSLLPGPGARITPAFAGQLPKIQAHRGPALATATGATYWRLQFLEVLPLPGSSTANLLELGDTGSAQSAMSMVPAHLVVDRCYIHGDAVQGQRRGIALNSADTQVVNSYFSDFKGVQQETQAVGGWNGPGPFLIENNYLEAAGENIMFGGGDPSIQGLVPGDITIRRNLITKPMEWRSQPWIVKNLIELKNAERVLIDGNVIENNWVASQNGAAVLMTPRNQDGSAPWSAVRHIVVQNNTIRHVGYGFNITGYDDLKPSQQTEDIVIRNNLLYDISSAYGNSDNATPAIFVMIGSGPKTVRLDHNTVNNDGGGTILLYGGYSSTGPLMWGLAFTNNLLRHNTYGLFGDATSSGTVALAAYAPDALVVRNTFADGPQAQYPSGNDFPSLSQWLQDFVDVGGQDYRLRSSSASKSRGTDGKDLGVDFVEFAAAQSNDGTATAPLPVTPPPPPPGGSPAPPSNPPYVGATVPGSGSSPDGTIVPTTATQIVDNSGMVWTVDVSGMILRNGVQAAGGWGTQMLWKSSTIYVLADGNWWQWTGAGWNNVGKTVPGSGSSPDGTIVPTTATQIVDNSGMVWTVDVSGMILRNGVQAAGGWGTQMLWKSSTIYVLADGNWWQWTGAGWNNVGKTVPGSGSSPDGTIVPTTATQIVDNAGMVWTIDVSGMILRNGVQAAGGWGTQILWKSSTIYVLADGSWFQWTGSGWNNVGATYP